MKTAIRVKTPEPKKALLGVFGGAKPPPPPAMEAAGADAGDGNVRTELLRLLRVPLDELTKAVDGGRVTVGAALARVLLKKATIDGQSQAITEVLDRIEGKPTKSAANKPSNDALTEQLDSSLASLDELTEEPKDSQ